MEFNYLNIIEMIKQGQNPQQLILNFLSGQMNSPMGANLYNLAKNGQGKEIEQIARNICSQRGMDFDKEFASFRKLLNI